MKIKDLSNHIVVTYKLLRILVALIAIAFPLILWIGGSLFGDLPLQSSISHYYHASDPINPGPAGHGVMRDVFVGILFFIGAFLIVYRGITDLENYTLNVAGILAFLVALLPMNWPPVTKYDVSKQFFSLHGACAVSFFICIAIVCIFCASDTLSLVKDKKKYKCYRRSYFIFGALMVAIPLLRICLKSFEPIAEWTTFIVEFFGISIFAAYWLVKSWEIFQTGFDKKAAHGKLHIEPRTLSETLRLHPLFIDDQNNSQEKTTGADHSN
jgi:hypothetical protein